MSKKTIFILLGAIIVIVAGIIIFGKGKNDDTKIVEIAKANKMTLVETVSATGKIQPEVEVKISSEVSGEVIALPIKEGQQVKKGDLLFFITGRKSKNINHVGLIVSVEANEINFIHSTNARGVIISSLSEKYWKNAFLKATKVL